MNTPRGLDKTGQCLWLENVTRESLGSELIRQYIEERLVSGLSIGPESYKDAIKQNTTYDADILQKLKDGIFGESLALDMVLADTDYAADLLRSVFDRTGGVDGWAVLSIPPLLMTDPSCLATEAIALAKKIQRPNVLITVPGLPEYLKTIEEIIFAGVPVNVSMLFSKKQYAAVLEIYLSALEKRIAANKKPMVGCFASIPISRLNETIALEFQGTMVVEAVVALARSMHKESKKHSISQRWQNLQNAGARPQRLVWVLGNDTDNSARDLSYMEYLPAPCTIAAMPERALKLFVEKDTSGVAMPGDGGDSEHVVSCFCKAGVDLDDLVARAQKNEPLVQIKAWIELLDTVAHKSAVLTKTMQTSSGM